MSFGDTIGWLICVVGGAGWIWLMPRFWRNERGVHSDTPHPYWVWGVRLWRALVRIGPLSGAMFVAGAFVPLEQVVTDDIWHGLVVGALAVAAATIFFCMFTVVLFNWPKWVVAPHHRHQRGLIAELLGKRSAPTPPPQRLPAWQRERRRRAPVP